MDNIVEALKPLAVPIDSIRPDDRNARVHPSPNIEAIKRSLSHYGQRKPVVVREEGRVIEAGNGLWLAARELGWDHIAAVFAADDPATATGFALMDNQSALLAEWDLPVLKDLLQELDGGAFEMDLTGFGAGMLPQMPQLGPELDESLADGVELCVCEKCGNEHAKKRK